MQFVGLPNMWIFANGFTYSTSFGNVDGKLTNVGVHAMINFLKPQQNKTAKLFFKWGGFDLTGGLEYAHMYLDLTHELDTSLPVTGPNGESGTVTMASQGQLTLDSTALAVSAELTTSFRILYIVGLYAGLGVDLQLGSNSGDVNLTGTMSGTDSNGGQYPNLASGTVNIHQDASPTPGQLRFLGGVQLNLFALKVFVQANYLPTHQLGVALGARVAW
jgi:hypothetical protein